MGGEGKQLCWNWGCPGWKINYDGMRTWEQDEGMKRVKMWYGEETVETGNQRTAVQPKIKKRGGGEESDNQRFPADEHHCNPDCGRNWNFLCAPQLKCLKWSMFVSHRAPASADADLKGRRTESCWQEDNMASSSQPRNPSCGLTDRSSSFFKVRTGQLCGDIAEQRSCRKVSHHICVADAEFYETLSYFFYLLY